FFSRSPGNSKALLMLTPQVYKPVTRVLILYHGRNTNPFFLETAARLSQTLNIQPLILTLATTEHKARVLQSFAEEVCYSLHLQADFDSVIAWDVCSAVSRIAVWRNCSHLFVERPKKFSLWQRWGSNILCKLRLLSDSLSLLAIPEGVSF